MTASPLVLFLCAEGMPPQAISPSLDWILTFLSSMISALAVASKALQGRQEEAAAAAVEASAFAEAEEASYPPPWDAAS
jgi:hypothetical protein